METCTGDREHALAKQLFPLRLDARAGQCATINHVQVSQDDNSETSQECPSYNTAKRTDCKREKDKEGMSSVMSDRPRETHT